MDELAKVAEGTNWTVADLKHMADRLRTTLEQEEITPEPAMVTALVKTVIDASAFYAYPGVTVEQVLESVADFIADRNHQSLMEYGIAVPVSLWGPGKALDRARLLSTGLPNAEGMARLCADSVGEQLRVLTYQRAVLNEQIRASGCDVSISAPNAPPPDLSGWVYALDRIMETVSDSGS